MLGWRADETAADLFGRLAHAPLRLPCLPTFPSFLLFFVVCLGWPLIDKGKIRQKKKNKR